MASHVLAFSPLVMEDMMVNAKENGAVLIKTKPDFAGVVSPASAVHEMTLVIAGEPKVGKMWSKQFSKVYGFNWVT